MNTCSLRAILIRTLVKRVVGPKFKRAGESVARFRELNEFAIKNQKVPGNTSVRPVQVDGIERALERAIAEQILDLRRHLIVLATTAGTAPFVGLFGTVWGIMNSFHGIGLRGSASLAVVAPGISEALVATAAGLAVAIPAVIAFNHFTFKIRMVESELNSFSADFLNIIERELIRVEGESHEQR